MNNHKFSNVYERIISSEDDFVGQIAYSLYKQRKCNYVKSKRLELNVNEVPDSAMEEFINQQDTEMLQYYRERAETLLREFLDASYSAELSEEIAKIDSECHKDYEKLARGQSWWYGVTQSLTASFLFVLIGYMLLKFAGVWDVLLNKLFG